MNKILIVVDMQNDFVTGAFGTKEAVAIVENVVSDCVVTNALILKTMYPENEITVKSYACAGVTAKTHIAALETMKMCQINIIE